MEAALQFLGSPVLVSSKAEDISIATKLLIPGVGSFKRAMSNLHELKLVDPILEAAGRGVPILGICLGMQLLAELGTEGGETAGLSLIPGKVVRLEPSSTKAKIPHVGFNLVSFRAPEPFVGLESSSADFYFVHSFQFVTDERFILGTADYFGEFVAAVRKENIWGMQFHPEKSQSNGLQVLRNFVALN